MATSSDTTSSSTTAPFTLIDNNVIGFNGQSYDAVSGTYLLGNGYRAYNPRLRTFHSQDLLSPFGVAGINRYQYCHLDPINFTDPSGHIGVQGGVAIGFGVLGAILGLFTFGAGFALLGAGALFAGAVGIAGGVLGIASAATGIASAVIEDQNPEIARALFWTSIGTGIASAFVGLGTVNALGKTGLIASRTFQPISRTSPFRGIGFGHTAGRNLPIQARRVGTPQNLFTSAYLNPKNSPAASAGGRINLNYQSGFGVTVAGTADFVSRNISTTTKALLGAGGIIAGAGISAGIYAASVNRGTGTDDSSVEELLPSLAAPMSSPSSQTSL